MTFFLLFWLFSVTIVQAFPSLLAGNSSVIPAVSVVEINSFNPYTYFAKAVYCDPSTIRSWTCGAACAGNRRFQPVAAGGNGNSIQYWFVGYEPSIDSIIVAHQGTNTSHIKPILTDGELSKGSLDPQLFPGISADIEAHLGFQREHAHTASSILSNVQAARAKYNTTLVTVVGHSLGAALALLDSVYLLQHLSRSTTLKTIVYGLPRVGNQAFADYVDAHLQLTHINNLKDPIPIVPGKLLGYVHPAGEIHIEPNGKWANCPGHDNPSEECIVGDVPSVFDCVEANHDGPYNGIFMHCNT